MKNFTLTSILILTLFLVSITDALEQKRYSNNALREQLLDYLLEAKQRELLYNQRRGLGRQSQRYQENIFDDDESSDTNNYGRTDNRRKAVGLGDNPYK